MHVHHSNEDLQLALAVFGDSVLRLDHDSCETEKQHHHRGTGKVVASVAYFHTGLRLFHCSPKTGVQYYWHDLPHDPNAYHGHDQRALQTATDQSDVTTC
jgi:hypothetical protein